MHQMLRGTGLAGLAGMGEARELKAGQTLLRPLLRVSRAAIESYAKKHNLRWVEDDSNLDTAYTRNFIRHDVMPVIAQRFPHYAESLARTAQHAHEAAELNEALATIDLKWDGTTAFAETLDSLSLTRQINALYYWLRWQQATPPSRLQLERWAGQLFRAAPEGKPQLAGGHDFVIRRRRHILTLEIKAADK